MAKTKKESEDTSTERMLLMKVSILENSVEDLRLKIVQLIEQLSEVRNTANASWIQLKLLQEDMKSDKREINGMINKEIKNKNMIQRLKFW